jgi:hypothetical protein
VSLKWGSVKMCLVVFFAAVQLSHAWAALKKRTKRKKERKKDKVDQGNRTHALQLSQPGLNKPEKNLLIQLEGQVFEEGSVGQESSRFDSTRLASPRHPPPNAHLTPFTLRRRPPTSKWASPSRGLRTPRASPSSRVFLLAVSVPSRCSNRG